MRWRWSEFSWTRRPRGPGSVHTVGLFEIADFWDQALTAAHSRPQGPAPVVGSLTAALQPGAALGAFL